MWTFGTWLIICWQKTMMLFFFLIIPVPISHGLLMFSFLHDRGWKCTLSLLFACDWQTVTMSLLAFYHFIFLFYWWFTNTTILIFASIWVNNIFIMDFFLVRLTIEHAHFTWPCDNVYGRMASSVDSEWSTSPHSLLDMPVRIHHGKMVFEISFFLL